MSGRVVPEKGITFAMWRRILGSDGETPCHYCGFPAIEVDHVVPVARGGGNDPENLVPACWECNSEKRDLTTDEWADKRRAAGKPWPVPSLDARIRWLMAWYRPSKVNRAGYPVIFRDGAHYEQYRSLFVEARDYHLDIDPVAEAS